MRKITLLLTLLLGIGGASAKTRTTTLWEGTYTKNIEIPVENLVEGATVTVYTTVTASDNADDRKLRIFYTAAGDSWTQTTFPDISDWVEREASSDSYSFTITSSAMSILKDDTQSHKILYIGAINSSYITISKITLTETLTPLSTGENLLSETWVPTEESNKEFDAIPTAKIGDVILVNISCPANWAWTEFYVRDKEGNDFVTVGNYGKSYVDATDDTYEYVISNLADLKKIRENGFIIRAKVNCSISSVKLLSYSDSYGYVTVNISDAGYATWSSDKKYDFSTAGITAYYASAVETGTVTLTSMDITWDYQGYILKATPGDYDVMESLTTDGTYYPSTNYLKYQVSEGTVNASESGDTKYRYIFAKHNSEIGFYKLTTDHTLAAHKAYLETPDDITPTANARVALIFDNSEPTAIKNVNEWNTEDFIYYNLNGVRVQNPTKGLYIVNGKKVVVR